MFQLLYPSASLSKKEPDGEYLPEFTAATHAGIKCFVYSEEDWRSGKLTFSAEVSTDIELIYRGWMFTYEEYQLFSGALKVQGISLLTSAQQYINCHYLPLWYPLCQNITPNTIFPKDREDISPMLALNNWSGYFVKDYVKSLTTQRGSIAYSITEIEEIIDLLKQYRGRIEGGICIREMETLQAETEERYFILKNKAFSRTGEIPEIVQKLATQIDSPFFSADIVLNYNNQPRLIELGDGQVSDIKKWTPEQFIQIFQ